MVASGGDIVMVACGRTNQLPHKLGNREEADVEQLGPLQGSIHSAPGTSVV